MKRMKAWRILGVVVLATMLLAACGGETTTPTATPVAPTATTAPVAAPTDTTAPSAAPTDTAAPAAQEQGTPTVAGVAQAGTNQPIKTPPLNVADHSALKGKNIQMAILGIAGWPPSSLGVDMSPDFSKYVEQKYGYTATFSFQSAPFSALFQKAATSLATKSQEYNIIISDSQWLGALSEPGWIINADDIIKLAPDLKIEWYAPVIETSYQIYPDGTNQHWGFPQETDVEVLYVRQDLFTDATEKANFKAKYSYDLPQTYEDWKNVDYTKFHDICEFFTRPDKGLYGTVMQQSKEYDFMSMYLYPFMYSNGGDIWDPNTRTVYGILNTDVNAKAMEQNKEFLKFQPPGAMNYGISEDADAFTQGKVATAFQWAAMGPTMITAANKDKSIIVLPPGVKQADGTIKRMYAMGGQPWVVNAFNDPEHMRVAIDFLQWWYLPETQINYAKKGGNPSGKATLESPGFDDIQLWFKAMKEMLFNSRDFWHDPTYSQLLSIQQEGWTAYASGAVTDAKKVLDWIACQQQKTLYDAGRSTVQPPANCPADYK